MIWKVWKVGNHKKSIREDWWIWGRRSSISAYSSNHKHSILEYGTLVFILFFFSCFSIGGDRRITIYLYDYSEKNYSQLYWMVHHCSIDEFRIFRFSFSMSRVDYMAHWHSCRHAYYRSYSFSFLWILSYHETREGPDLHSTIESVNIVFDR